MKKTVTIHNTPDGWKYQASTPIHETRGPITSLDELLYLLRGAELADDSVGMDSLPTFGGQEPADTQGVWSWDEDRLLVGEGFDDLEIVSRDEWGAG